MPDGIVLYVVIETLVDQSEVLQGRRVKMRGDPCEDFGRDIKQEAQRVVTGAILGFSAWGRFRNRFLGMSVLLGNFVGPTKHKTGKSDRVKDGLRRLRAERWLR